MRADEKARAAIEPASAENKEVFNEYGPENDYRFNPESEVAQVWQRKVLSRILPNNRKVLAVLDSNRRHLRGQEPATLEQFRQHVDDLEARHLGEGEAMLARRFPNALEAILTDSGNRCWPNKVQIGPVDGLREDLKNMTTLTTSRSWHPKYCDLLVPSTFLSWLAQSQRRASSRPPLKES